MYLTDRINNLMPVINDCNFCMNTILNGKPLSLLTDEKAVKSLGIKEGRLDLTVESKDETKDLIRAFSSVYLYGEEGSDNLKEFTRGHFYRGVE